MVSCRGFTRFPVRTMRGRGIRRADRMSEISSWSFRRPPSGNVGAQDEPRFRSGFFLADIAGAVAGRRIGESEGKSAERVDEGIDRGLARGRVGWRGWGRGSGVW